MTETTGTSLTFVTGTIVQDAEIKTGSTSNGTQYECSITYIDVAEFRKKLDMWYHTKYKLVGYKTENSRFQFDKILALKKGDHVQAVGELILKAYIPASGGNPCCSRTFSNDVRVTVLHHDKTPVATTPKKDPYDADLEDIPF